MVFCNIKVDNDRILECSVTILILIDGFLQCRQDVGLVAIKNCHNPYFNRWFSAMWLNMFEYKGIKLSQSLF